jgi:hypothetical protein
MDLLKELRFDVTGAAVGSGSFEIPERVVNRFGFTRSSSLALQLSRAGEAGEIRVAGPHIAPGLNASEPEECVAIVLSAAVAAFLRRFLAQPRPQEANLLLRCDSDLPFAQPGSLRIKTNEQICVQDIYEVAVSVCPLECGRRVTVEASRFGPTKVDWKPAEPVVGEGEVVKATVDINESNLCGIFGAGADRSGEYPKRKFERSDHSSL